MTEEQIQPQSAVDSQPKFQKPRKQKVRKDPNAPFIREKLELPEGHNKLLLHSCCAPCSGEVMEAILASGIEFTIYFYNPNIHPLKEYLIRKEENIRFAQKFGIPFIDADYDRQQWFDRAKGMEWEPERGIRCTMCFDMRFEKAAEYAHEHGFPVFTSCLGISRWKDMDQINGCGHRAAEKYDDVIYWDYNWRKAGGSQRMIEISKRERFYQQEYCGCVYSLRDSNKWREETGRQKIEIGYENVDKITFKDIQAFHDKYLSKKPYTYVILASEKKLPQAELQKIGEFKKVSLEELFGF